MPSPLPTLSSVQTYVTSSTRRLRQEYAHLTDGQQAGLTAGATVLASMLTAQVYRRKWKRIRTAEHVKPEWLAKRKTITGVATRVGDSDNFRIYHQPGFSLLWRLGLRRVPSDNKSLKDQTIHIRIAGVDAPEAAHFGNEAQPMSEESLAFLQGLVEGRRVRVTLLRRDRYGRIVGLPYLPRLGFFFWPRVIPVEMIRAGMASLYVGGDAEYGSPRILKKLQTAQAYAKHRKIGIWSLKKGQLELPGDFKKRMANGGSAKASPAKVVPDTPISGGLVRRILRRFTGI